MQATFERLDERMREVEQNTRSNREKISAHEDICAERYKTINESIGAIRSDSKQTNAYLIGIGLMVLAGLAKLVFFP